MKILISTDIEGVAGVFHPEQTRQGNIEYEKARVWMSAEANAAVKGAFDGGADEVYVNDSHGTFRNIIPHLIDPRAKLIQGKPRYLSMASGVERKPDGMYMIGYHAKSKSSGILAHTINGSAFSRIWVNELELGEAGLYGALAGEFAVPVLFASGDDVFIAETKLLFPQANFVETKQAEGNHSGLSRTPEQACKLIYDAAFKAIAQPSHAKPFYITGPYHCRLQTQTPAHADLFCQLPQTTRVDGDTLTFTSDTMQSVIRTINCFSAMSFMLK